MSVIAGHLFPRVIQVIASEARRGDGKVEPIRMVRQYHTLDGQFLAERDYWIEGQVADAKAEAKEP